MLVEVQNLFLGSCFSSQSLRYQLSIAFPSGWLSAECSGLKPSPHIPSLKFECVIKY